MHGGNELYCLEFGDHGARAYAVAPHFPKCLIRDRSGLSIV